MSKQRIDGVWVIVCDWIDSETDKACDLGLDGDPKMFVDPDGGQDPETHYQCGAHHGVIKQEDDPNFQVPKDHKLADDEEKRTVITTINIDPDKKRKKVELDGFKPDASGRVWDGKKFDV